MTEDEEAHLSMYMRIVEFFRQHEDLVNNSPEMQESVTTFKGLVEKIFDLLPEEDHDRALDRYREDLKYLNIIK